MPEFIATLTGDKSSDLPVILSLHGRGSNSMIFQIQSRRLIQNLKSSYRFLFVEAPFSCEAGPGILPVFETCGPYATWTSTKLLHPPVNPSTGEYKGAIINRKEIIELVPWDDRDIVMGTIDAAVREKVVGGWDKVVGLMGFSQGGRLSAGLLMRQLRMMRRQQKQQQDGGNRKPHRNIYPTNFKFGIIIGAPLPPVLLVDQEEDIPMQTNTSGGSGSSSSSSTNKIPNLQAIKEQAENDYSLLSTFPTVHAWGKKDPYIDSIEALAERCQGKMCYQMDFEGGHHLPLTDGGANKLCLLIKRAAAAANDMSWTQLS